VTYSSTPLSPLNTPSGANTEGAFVVGKSPQQLSAKFLMSYSTNSTSFSLKSSMALRESEPLSTISTGLRFLILILPPPPPVLPDRSAYERQTKDMK
jgi:hypothetical protein